MRTETNNPSPDSENVGKEADHEAGLSSAMHDMRMLATRYRAHREASKPAPLLPLRGAAVDPRVLLMPRPQPGSDRFRLAMLMMMVFLGLSTSALAVTLAFRGGEVGTTHTLRPLVTEQPHLVAPEPSFVAPAIADEDASVSESTRYEVTESPESSRANPQVREQVAPLAEGTSERRARILAQKKPRVGKPSGCDEVACLLEGGACCGRDEREAPGEISAAEDVAARPYRLSRQQVMTAMQSIRGRVLSCYDEHDYKGVALVKIVIAPEGSVQSFDLDDGGASFQACVEKQVTKLEFPRLQQPFTVAYPFTLRN